ncbi:MAG: hypothetical protein HC933_18270 [Pleurocapsa sp. SU_196_0]|nr:hypothetical protein [Pleurocapsa sp. SU_196_0]
MEWGRPGRTCASTATPGELETTGGAELLRRIAERSGGRVLTTLEGYAGAVEVSRVSLAGWVAVLGLLLLMAELAYRRFRT